MRVEKTFEIKSAEPMDRDQAMQKINAMAGRTIDPDSVFIGRMVLSTDQYDRSYERIPVTYQQRLAATLPGKPVLTAHAKQQPAVGRYFGADVHWDDGGTAQLLADYYLPAHSDLTQRIKLGIVKEVSIGFMAAGRDCDMCKAPYDGPTSKCPHQVGRSYDGTVCRLTYAGNVDKVEALEGSFVGIGANPGAQTMTVGTKAWLPGGGLVTDEEGEPPQPVPPAAQEKSMDEQGYKDRIAALEAEVAAQKSAASEFQTKVVEMEPKAKDGELWRIDRRDEYIRLSNLVAGRDDAAAPMLPFLETASIKQILDLIVMKKAEWEAKCPPSPQSKLLDAGAIPAPDMRGDGGAAAARAAQPFDPHASLKRAY